MYLNIMQKITPNFEIWKSDILSVKRQYLVKKQLTKRVGGGWVRQFFTLLGGGKCIIIPYKCLVVNQEVEFFPNFQQKFEGDQIGLHCWELWGDILAPYPILYNIYKARSFEKSIRTTNKKMVVDFRPANPFYWYFPNR